MPNTVAYSSGATPSGSLGKGTISYGLDRTGGSLKWYATVNPDGRYILYSDTYSQGIDTQANGKPTAWASADQSDASLLALINGLPERIGQSAFGTVADALAWLDGTGHYFLVNKEYPNITTDGLVFMVDAGFKPSYRGSGTTWYDLSGFNSNASLVNGPTFDSDGAIVFDGVDDFINPNTTFSFPGEFTVTCVFKQDTASERSFLGRIEGSTKLIFLTDYNIFFRMVDGGSAVNFPIGYGSSNLGKWNYITATRDGDGTLKASLNGAPYVVNAVRTGTFEPNLIGKNNSGQFWDGGIANMRIYNRSFTETELLQNYYQAPIVTDGLVFAVDAGNLVSYENGSTTMYSLTGSNDAKFYNGPNFVDEYGGGIERDATDDFITGSITVPSTTYTFSVETWFKANPGSGYKALISAWHVPSGGAGGWEFQFSNGSLGVHPTYTVSYTANTLAHAVYTQNGTEAKIYLNGVLQQTSTVSTDLRNGRIGLGNLSAPGYSSYNLDSTFYTTRIYNKTLTAQEVQQNYNAQRSRFPQQATTIVEDGLVLCLDAAHPDSYPGSGTTWKDLRGLNNGTLTNGPSFSTDGQGSIVFDGVDDVIRITQNSGLTPSYFTTEAWIKLNATQASRIFIATFSESQSGIAMGINDGVSNNVKFFTSGNGSTGYDHLYQIGTLNNNEWYHVVCTYDGTQKILYINGQLNTSKSYAQAIGYVGNDFTVGGLDYNGSIIQRLNGSLSLAKMYNRALSASEVLQNYNATKGRFGL